MLNHPGHLAMDQKASLKALEANIVEACTNHQLAHWRDDNYRPCVSIGTDYFVKFGGLDLLWPEIQTQSYIFNYAKFNPHPDAPRIPEVVHHFRHERTMYLVMEFITFTAAPLNQTEQALVWLSSVPPPPNHVIGPLGGRIHHRFFKDGTAPLLLSSVEALQRYIRKVRPCFYFLEHPPFANVQSGPGVQIALEPGPDTAVSRRDER